MKRFKTFIYLVIGAVALNSCGEDFLSGEPITKKTEDSYYTNPEEAAEALIGCYDAMQRLNGLGMVLGPVMMGDNCFGSAGNTDGSAYPMLDEIDPSVSPGDNNVFGDAWDTHYTAIYRCNVLISKIEQIDWSNAEDQKPIIEAEARYLRAFLYFQMVRMFERIPLLTEPSKAIIPQAEPDEVYAVIVEDLKFAIENADATPYDEIPDDFLGHANKWAAEAMLGRVYLYYTGYYQTSDLLGLVTQAQALEYLEDVISNSGYGYLDNFGDLWPASARYEAAAAGKALDDNTYAGETNKEILFSIRYTYTGSWESAFEGPDWMDDIGMRGDNYPKYGYGTGWGISSVVPEFYDAYADGDLRKAASIMAIEEEGIDYEGYTGMQEYTGYFIKKYTIMCDEEGNYLSEVMGGTTDFQFNQFVDFIIMRYTDVLLMAAELGSANALDYFNSVHTRAGLDPVASIDKDAIFNERRFEFAFEGIRYWDLLRYDGKNNLDYAANALSISTTVLSSSAEVEKVIDGNNIKNTFGLFQIPQNQIDLSGEENLEQNPGW